MTRSRAHNLKIGDLPRTCACGNLCGSSGQCRECFLKANPDLAEYYASKQVVAIGKIGNGQVVTVDQDKLRTGWINSDRIAANEAAAPLADEQRKKYEAWEVERMRQAAQRGIDNGGFMGHDD